MKQRPSIITAPGLLAVTLAVVLIVVAILLFQDDAPPRPAPAFEAHIQALIDEDWDKALGYLSGECKAKGVDANYLERTFGLLDEGDVEELHPTDELVGEGRAMLYISGLDDYQEMTREDGQWKLVC